jgi:two-component system, LytTR family, response regulator
MASPQLTTLIAEDEPLARAGLAQWVNEMPDLQLVGTASNGPEALQAIRQHQPQLVLMDIQMPGLTGLQVLRALNEDRNSSGSLPAVIFTTAYDEHALTAFELHAVDYLLKPFERERFDEAVQHVLAQQGADPSPSGAALEAAVQAAEQAAEHAAEFSSATNTEPLLRLLVRDVGKIVPLQVEHIEHLRSDTKYTAIVTGGKTYFVRLPITHFGQRLDPQRFLKVNRSCIVNLDFVVAMTPDESSQLVVQLRDGNRFTASRDVSKQLRADSL